MTLGLLSNGKYNIEAVLFADENDFIVSRVDIVCFGNTFSNFVDRKTIERQSVLIQYDEALRMFEKHYPEIQVIEGLKRVKKQPIPYEAFREAIANAIAHRNYVINSHIKIEIKRQDVEDLLGVNKSKAIDLLDKMMKKNLLESQG